MPPRTSYSSATPVSTTASPSETNELVVCSGCGGRNPRDAQFCDWCSRPFASPVVRYRPSRWQAISGLGVLLVVLTIAVLGYLNASRTVTPRAASPVATATAVLPTLAPTARPALAPPTTPVPPAAPAPAANSGAAARVGNTGGTGVQVRSEPGAQARPLGVLKDGATVTLTGNDQTVAARLWREVQTADGALKGWVSADYLQPAP